MLKSLVFTAYIPSSYDDWRLCSTYLNMYYNKKRHNNHNIIYIPSVHKTECISSKRVKCYIKHNDGGMIKKRNN